MALPMKRKTRVSKTTRHRRTPTRLPAIGCEDAKVEAPPTVRPRLMAFKDACRYGGFGKWKGYALIRDGKLIAYKMGKKTMVEVASIDAFHASLPKLGPSSETSNHVA